MSRHSYQKGAEVNFRSIISVTAVAVLATALAFPVQAGESTRTTKTPAKGSFDLLLSQNAFAEFRRAGLSVYSIGGPRVDTGDDGELGMEFNVRAVDGTGRTFTEGGEASVIWWNGPPNRYFYIGSPTLIGDSREGTISAGVFTGSGTNIFDLGRTTLFDVDKRRTVKQPNGEFAYYQYRLTLHDGAEDLLNSALGTSFFTPGMRLGTLLLDVDAGS